MKRIIALALVLLAVVAMAASCSSNKKTGRDPDKATAEKEPTDVDTIAKALVTVGHFEGTLEKIDAVEYVYTDLPEGTEAAVYQSTAYSDEVAVFRTKDVDTVKGIVEAYIASRVTTFNDYAPEQADKVMNNGVVVTGDDIVILMISTDSAVDATTLIDSFID